jgi:hypothetical protein
MKIEVYPNALIKKGCKLNKRTIKKVFTEFFPDYNLTDKLYIFGCEDTWFELVARLKDMPSYLMDMMKNIGHLNYDSWSEYNPVFFKFFKNNKNEWEISDNNTYVRTISLYENGILRMIDRGELSGNDVIEQKSKCMYEFEDEKNFYKSLEKEIVQSFKNLQQAVDIVFEDSFEKNIKQINDMIKQKDDFVNKVKNRFQQRVKLFNDF